MRSFLLALLILAGALCAGLSPVSAQGCGPSNPGCIVPTAPAGTSDNRAASTAFVANAISVVQINSETGNYSVQTTDCGKTLALGGGTQFTLTVGAPAGFSVGCVFNVVNTDTGRGKIPLITGLNFPNGGVLWPRQAFVLSNISGAWTLLQNPGRYRPTANVNLYLDSVNGSDSNDGLAPGTGGAFATMAAALNAACQNIDPQANSIQINVARNTGPYNNTTVCQLTSFYDNNSYTQLVVIQTPSTVTITIANPGVVTWTAHGLSNGDVVFLQTTGALPTGLAAATPYYVINSAASTFQLALTPGGAAIITTGSQSGTQTAVAPKQVQLGGNIPVFATSSLIPVTFNGFQFVTCTITCVYADSGGVISLEQVDFTATTAQHVQAIFGARIRLKGGYSISGNAAQHLLAQHGGMIFATGAGGVTVGLSNSPVFSGSFLAITVNGTAVLNNMTFVGSSATGNRLSIDSGALYTGTGCSATYFPGNAFGSVTSPGYCN